MEINIQTLFSNYVVPWAIQAVMALLVFYVGRIVARWLSAMLEKQMKRQGLDDMLVRLSRNTAYFALMALVVLAALDQLGVDTTSALAVFGAAGLAVGLALKDSLSNFAAGVLIALFQPFRLGHFIETAGASGTVMDVGMFNTILKTPDNKQVVVPNRLVYNDTIVNYSAEDTRRIDMVFGIGYEDDIELARKLIESTMTADERILKEPEAMVAVSELADSSVNFVVRPWVKAEDYWDVRFAMLEQVKLAFDKNGVSIPYPQQDIHLHQSKAD